MQPDNNITPLPWDAEIDGDCIYSDTTGKYICIIPSSPEYTTKRSLKKWEANAAYIVKCCNNYPKLLELLKDTRKCMEDVFESSHPLLKEIVKTLDGL